MKPSQDDDPGTADGATLFEITDSRPDAGESVMTSAAHPADPRWKEYLDQLRSRGALWRRYDKRGEIARGGMGIVLRVFDKDARRTLAMKVIRDENERGASRDAQSRGLALGRFLEEAQVASQLDHPGIVPVHEIGLDDSGRVYFTMKLVKGEDLSAIFARVRKGDPCWTLTHALATVQKVCEAMGYAHAKGVIHRDLKPANVMVGAFGETYVMDWGLARVAEQEPRPSDSPKTSEGSIDAGGALLTRDGEVMGTPAFMSPEQAAGERVGPATDVYAVGAMLYQLVTGRVPFSDQEEIPTAHSILERLRHGPPTPLLELAPDVPAELVAIVEKAMARAPAQRYASMEALGTDLRAFLEGRVVSAYDVGAFATLRKWIARNRGLATAIAAAILIAIGAALLVAWRERQSMRQVDAARARVMQTSDLKRLGDLETAMDSLWPAFPAQVPAMEAWLAQAKELLARRPEHRRTLADLRAGGRAERHPAEAERDALKAEVARATALPDTDRQALAARIAALDAEIRDHPRYAFPDAETAWWHAALCDLCRDLDAFAADDPFGRTLASVERRVLRAREVERASLVDRAAEWDAAIAAVAASSRYRGLALARQIGLAPLGADPRSGFQEFADVQTGAVPRRDATGRLGIGPDTGVVFVLLPGGSFVMGAQHKEASASGHDPHARDDESDSEGRAAAVEVEPFLLSKYEMTQGQWLRATGADPSFFSGAPEFPVERLDWATCERVMRQLGFELPTEAQWEYAARADGVHASPCCDSTIDFPRFANLRDESFRRASDNPGECEKYDDGRAFTAPVGSYDPNGFGLHDVFGNVWEWCRDGYVPYDLAVKGADAVRFENVTRDRVVRGGGYDTPVHQVRASFRGSSEPTYNAGTLGVRPARRVARASD